MLLALAKSIYYCYCPTCIKHAMQSTNKHSPTGVQSLMRATDIVGVRQNPRNHLNLQKTKNQFSFTRQQRNPPSQVIVSFRWKYFIRRIIILQILQYSGKLTYGHTCEKSKKCHFVSSIILCFTEVILMNSFS